MKLSSLNEIPSLIIQNNEQCRLKIKEKILFEILMKFTDDEDKELFDARNRTVLQLSQQARC